VPRFVAALPASRSLTLPAPAGESKGQVRLLESNFYAEWRRRSGVLPALREDHPQPPERLLQRIWQHQRLRRDRLTTLDGQRVQVLHPGFWNHEAGPDFTGAVLQFDGGPPRSGGVEIDLVSSGWRAHGHDRNPVFQDVLLHVVWDCDGATALPTLVLKPLLDSPLPDLVLWLSSDSAAAFPATLAGQCAAPLGELAADRLNELLHQAALVRLQSKAVQFQARARQAGWDQALWEGLLRGLGYKHNVWPMQRLAELRQRLAPREANLPAAALQARLLGVAGLLPTELPRRRSSSPQYLRQLWDHWWRERETFSDCLLPRSLWRFSGLRPANHPERRLALAAHWLHADEVPARLEGWCKKTASDADLPARLLELLQAPDDEFWSWHWTLRSPRLPKPQPMLGATRVADLAMNVILPWLWIRAAEGRNEALQRELERRYLAWPAGEDNAVLRLARARLLGQAGARRLRSAAAQQGLLQIVRDFCEHSNSLCANCRFPELVREWREP
jgi:hypothetical protein